MQVSVQFYQPGFQPRDPVAFSWFCAVDTNRSGTVDEHELQRALSNGGFTAFSKRTTRKLMRMFDADRSNTLGYGEFEQLVAYLRMWQAQFTGATMGTGRLSQGSMPAVLAQLGYSFPPPLTTSIFLTCACVVKVLTACPALCSTSLSTPSTRLLPTDDEDHSGTIGIDEFISMLAEMHSLTALFRAHDPAGTGSANLQYATFMQMVYASRC